MEDPGLSRSSSSSRLNLFSEAQERMSRTSSDSSLGVYTEEAERSTGAVAGKEEQKIERTVPKITFSMGREE